MNNQQPTSELQKAIEHYEQCDWTTFDVAVLVSAAKRVEQLEKENSAYLLHYNGMLEETFELTGKTVTTREENAKALHELKQERDSLKAALLDNSYLFAELEGVVMGLMMHPSDLPLNGCLISEASKEKIKNISSIIERYKSNPHVQSVLKQD